jgi:hypothetical protein
MVSQWENNVSQDEIVREMRTQPAYIKRFPAMSYLSGIGQAINEVDYIRAESEYRSAISTLGTQYKDFYSTDYIGKMMMNDVSPVEATKRVAAAQEYIYSTAPRSVVEALRNQYGLTDGDMVAYMLDPENLGQKVLSDFETRRARADVLGAANEAGLALSNRTADEIAARNYTYGNSAEKFDKVRRESATLSQLAAISNGSLTDSEVLAAEFSLEGGTKAKKKIKGLASQERARFSGSSGIGGGSLAGGGLGSR